MRGCGGVCSGPSPSTGAAPPADATGRGGPCCSRNPPADPSSPTGRPPPTAQFLSLLDCLIKAGLGACSLWTLLLTRSLEPSMPGSLEFCADCWRCAAHGCIYTTESFTLQCCRVVITPAAVQQYAGKTHYCVSGLARPGRRAGNYFAAGYTTSGKSWLLKSDSLALLSICLCRE